MPLSVGMSLLIILAVALTTFATRVVPFLIFPMGKEIPDVVQYLGRVLTPAVIGMLVVYCLKTTPVLSPPMGYRKQRRCWSRPRSMSGRGTTSSASEPAQCCICFLCRRSFKGPPAFLLLRKD